MAANGDNTDEDYDAISNDAATTLALAVYTPHVDDVVEINAVHSAVGPTLDHAS